MSEGADAAWRRLRDRCERADPDSDWFAPKLLGLLDAVDRHPDLRSRYPVEAMNQIGFAPEQPREDAFPPGIGVGSAGFYAVVDQIGPSGRAVMETSSPDEALQRLAGLLND